MSDSSCFSKSGYISYDCKYSDSIDSGLGSWFSIKSSDLSFEYDVLNNIRLISYNYDYGVHQPLSLLYLILQPSIILQAVDKVIDTFKLYSATEFEMEEGGVKISTKKELWNAVLKNHKKIYVVNPNKSKGNKNILIENLEYVIEMEEYLTERIRRALYIQAIRKYRKLVKTL